MYVMVWKAPHVHQFYTLNFVFLVETCFSRSDQDDGIMNVDDINYLN